MRDIGSVSSRTRCRQSPPLPRPLPPTPLVLAIPRSQPPARSPCPTDPPSSARTSPPRDRRTAAPSPSRTATLSPTLETNVATSTPSTGLALPLELPSPCSVLSPRKTETFAPAMRSSSARPTPSILATSHATRLPSRSTPICLDPASFAVLWTSISSVLSPVATSMLRLSVLPPFPITGARCPALRSPATLPMLVPLLRPSTATPSATSASPVATSPSSRELALLLVPPRI
mmetsp:Transcript_14906/g.43024  ORF Transcript_14906/g.43024 Transcript_14906/m.43024 type:complete len:232 (+) Transcript_14906:613-1308(+)